MLRQLQEGPQPKDDSPETATDQYLNDLCYKDFPALRTRAKLTVKAKDKKLDVFFHGRITTQKSYLCKVDLQDQPKDTGHEGDGREELASCPNGYVKSYLIGLSEF